MGQKDGTHMFSGHEEKKKVYLLLSAHTLDNCSRSKNSPITRIQTNSSQPDRHESVTPIGIPHKLRNVLVSTPGMFVEPLTEVGSVRKLHVSESSRMQLLMETDLVEVGYTLGRWPPLTMGMSRLGTPILKRMCSYLQRRLIRGHSRKMIIPKDDILRHVYGSDRGNGPKESFHVFCLFYPSTAKEKGSDQNNQRRSNAKQNSQGFGLLSQ